MNNGSKKQQSKTALVFILYINPSNYSTVLWIMLVPLSANSLAHEHRKKFKPNHGTNINCFSLRMIHIKENQFSTMSRTECSKRGRDDP